MIYCLILYTDRPGTAELRARVRPQHRDYINSGAEGVKLVLGGPTTDDAGAAGALLVVDAPSLDAVRRFSAADPYVTEGIVAQAEIREWNWTTGRPS